MTNFTAQEKYTEALREVRMRLKVYPRDGTISAQDQRHLAIMQEIAADYARLIEHERLL
jgi:hypothetical protein